MIWLLLFATLARAGDDIFIPPPAALAVSKYSADCGGDTPDLRPEMPPVDDQGQVGWCATFTARALLEHFYHRGLARENDRFSVMDLNSLSSERPPAEYARIPDLNPDDGGNPFMILEGAQAFGQIYCDQDYPLDQRHWDRTGRLARLSAYYDRQQIYAGDPELLACREQDPEITGVETQFREIERLLAGLGKGDFLSAAGSKFALTPAPRTGAQREPLTPAFNVRSRKPKTGDEFADELRNNLRQHRPTSLAVCANQMRQLPGLGRGAPLPPKDKTLCGGHALVAVGMKTENEKCLVQVRNSWGSWWPKPAAGGYAWIPLEDLLRVQDSRGSLVSLAPQAGETANHVDFDSGGYAEGKTWRMMLDGTGKLFGDRAVDEGEFRHGFLVQGRRTEKAGNVLTGAFANGLFVRGNFRGKLIGGAFYDGDYAGGQITGRGKRVEANGATFEGSFLNGQPMEGHFKGLIDEAQDLYYDGEMRGGQTVPTGKFTDKDGKPWVWR